MAKSYKYRKVNYKGLDTIDYEDIFKLFLVAIKSSKFFLLV